MDNLYTALVHYPVVNKQNKTIGSALTTIDMHDIARASMTYGVRRFYVITPYPDQANLAEEVIRHWTQGNRVPAESLPETGPGIDPGDRYF